MRERGRREEGLGEREGKRTERQRKCQISKRQTERNEVCVCVCLCVRAPATARKGEGEVKGNERTETDGQSQRQT